MTLPRLLVLALCALAGACAGATAARADAVTDFYAGRTVTIVVGSAAAGGYDTVARAVARHIGKHMPANPGFIVRNMPGAGGMTATNFLYNNAEKDGGVIGLVQNNTPFEPLFGTKEARYDAVKFNWLGSPSSETAMVLLWHAVPVNSIAELRAREVAVGVSGANSTPAFFARLLNATLGTKMKAINGYPGQNDVLLAMERGEVDGHPSAFVSSVRSTRPTWLRDRTAKAIVQYGAGRLAELGDVPSLSILWQTTRTDSSCRPGLRRSRSAGRSWPRRVFRPSAWLRCARRLPPPSPIRHSWRREKNWASRSTRHAAESKSGTWSSAHTKARRLSSTGCGS
jgi:tripartite-type tricarboxylate transporter receptor subunit TctC